MLQRGLGDCSPSGRNRCEATARTLRETSGNARSPAGTPAAVSTYRGWRVGSSTSSSGHVSRRIRLSASVSPARASAGGRSGDDPMPGFGSGIFSQEGTLAGFPMFGYRRPFAKCILAQMQGNPEPLSPIVFHILGYRLGGYRTSEPAVRQSELDSSRGYSQFAQQGPLAPRAERESPGSGLSENGIAGLLSAARLSRVRLPTRPPSSPGNLGWGGARHTSAPFPVPVNSTLQQNSRTTRTDAFNGGSLRLRSMSVSRSLVLETGCRGTRVATSAGHGQNHGWSWKQPQPQG